MKLSQSPTSRIKFRYPPEGAPRPLNPYVIVAGLYISLMLSVIAAAAALDIQARIQSANATATAVQSFSQATRVPFPTRAMPVTPTQENYP